tara:strand:+ start:2888 stop:3154 length:267 start_codon:yes stop_codon:yes gene_type:complete
MVFFIAVVQALSLSFGFYTVKVKSELRKLMYEKSVSDGQIAVARLHRQIYEKYDAALLLNSTGSIFPLSSLGDDFDSSDFKDIKGFDV